MIRCHTSRSLRVLMYLYKIKTHPHTYKYMYLNTMVELNFEQVMNANYSKLSK